jgi:hypothetical protein
MNPDELRSFVEQIHPSENHENIESQEQNINEISEQKPNEIVIDEIPVVPPVVIEEKPDDSDLYSINSFSL